MPSKRSADVAEEEINRFINKRYKERRGKSPEEKAEEEFMKLTRDRQVSRQEANRLQWIEFHRGRANFHYGEATRHLQAARQYEHMLIDGSGAALSTNGHGTQREE
jgi:hypothetical protein